MKTSIYYLMFALALLFISCQKNEVLDSIDNISVSVMCETGTKLSFDDSSLTFTKGDELTLNIEGMNSAKLSNDNSESVNAFVGYLRKIGRTKKDAKWYICYPSIVDVSSTGVITSTLPVIQNAPYDKSAIVMYSNVITNDYDEESIPALNFKLNHTTGLVKITIVNSDSIYESEVIESIQLSSSSILSGTFSIDIHKENPSPVFSQYSFNRVISKFQSIVSLGNGVHHTVYLIVNPTILEDCTISVITNSHIFTKKSDAVIDIKPGILAVLQTLNLNSFSVKDRSSEEVKKLSCWGSSVVNAGYSSFPNNLQDLLGEKWTVLNGGVSGDRIDEIAARQGGLGLVTNKEFTLPNSGYVDVDGGIFRTRNNACEEGLYHIRHYHGALSNPCSIMGIPCNVTSSSTYPDGKDIDDPSATFTARIQRIGNGDPVTIPAHTPILSYGAINAKDSDLQILFGGGNGVYVTYGEISDPHYYDNLMKYHQYMIEFNTKQSDYLILCYWMGYVWNIYYYESFINAFDDNRVVDLRRIIPSRGRELMVRTGAYPDEASIPQSELDRVDKGDWPYCFWHSETDEHPSEYGARAIAIVVYERMQALGYIY